LNASGYTFSHQELLSFLTDDRYILLACSLKDKYGDYGTIALSLIEVNDDDWTIALLITSCRVMSRGVSSVLLANIINAAKNKEKRLLAKYVGTDRNRVMLILYRFMGFKTLNSIEGESTLIYESRESAMELSGIKVESSAKF
jgi:FkbH-like protein